jgi:cation diffusion facilitator family transporter
MSPPGTEGEGRRADVEHRRAANRAIGVSALGLLLTGGVELFLAGVTHSVGLLSDAIHNLSDVSTSAVVFLGFFFSKRTQTERYPYGFERAEDIAGLGVAMVIWASAVFAGVESYRKLVSHGPTAHLGWGMLGACLGVAGNQAVAWYKRRVGTRISSVTLLADAKHSWLDAVSSFGALVGLVLVALGFRLGDPIAGFAITLLIVHVGWEVTNDVVHHLMDGMDPDDIEAARRAAEAAGGVRVPVVRGRWTGRSMRFELEPVFEAGSTARDIEALADRMRGAVREALEQATTVIVVPHTSARVHRPAPDRRSALAPGSLV